MFLEKCSILCNQHFEPQEKLNEVKLHIKWKDKNNSNLLCQNLFLKRTVQELYSDLPRQIISLKGDSTLDKIQALRYVLEVKSHGMLS